jgi:hypothetical protein
MLVLPVILTCCPESLWTTPWLRYPLFNTQLRGKHSNPHVIIISVTGATAFCRSPERMHLVAKPPQGIYIPLLEPRGVAKRELSQVQPMRYEATQRSVVFSERAKEGIVVLGFSYLHHTILEFRKPKPTVRDAQKYVKAHGTNIGNWTLGSMIERLRCQAF